MSKFVFWYIFFLKNMNKKLSVRFLEHLLRSLISIRYSGYLKNDCFSSCCFLKSFLFKLHDNVILFWLFVCLFLSLHWKRDQRKGLLAQVQGSVQYCKRDTGVKVYKMSQTHLQTKPKNVKIFSTRVTNNRCSKLSYFSQVTLTL